jgi:RNA polymerase sigma factor (sigma-70 family)
MPNGRYGGVIRQVDALFHAGTAAGLADGPLIERFTRQDGEASEAAFAVLVERHGPMVLRVCRAILRDPEEAQDAFQAVFLVLVLRAGTIRKGDSLACWLHGVAARVAARARSVAARRRNREQTAAGLKREVVANDPADDDLAAPLLEELNRLPGRYAAPIVLCHLQGLTHEQAARQLGWPVGTVRSRLARGRERLKRRLTSRGLSSLPGFFRAMPSSEVSPALIDATVRAATDVAAGRTAISAVVPSTAASLANGVLRTMTVIRWKMVATLAMTLGVLGAGAAVVAQSAGEARKAAEAKPKGADPAPRPADEKDRVIQRQLAKRLAFDLPDGATLENLLKYIRLNTKDEAMDLPQGIPIYVDPVALQQADVSLVSPVNVLYKGSTVKHTLTQALGEFRLAFDVQDGLLSIVSPTAALERRLERVEDKLDRVLQALEAAKRPPGK